MLALAMLDACRWTVSGVSSSIDQLGHAFFDSMIYGSEARLRLLEIAWSIWS